MKKIATLALLIAFGAVFNSAPVFADVTSLRQGTGLQETNKVYEFKRWQHDSRPIERQFVQQPPIIPHKIEGYQVNLNFNKCLSCHSWSNYKQAEATKISLTHFKDRDGNELSDVSPRRYFCTQCHVPQVDAPALVENEFAPVKSLGNR